MEGCANDPVGIGKTEFSRFDFNRDGTYSVFLDSSSVGTIDDIDKRKGLRQILSDDLIHDIRLANTRTVNNNYAFLKYKTKTYIKMIKLYFKKFKPYINQPSKKQLLCKTKTHSHGVSKSLMAKVVFSPSMWYAFLSRRYKLPTALFTSTVLFLVSLAAVLCLITQRSSPQTAAHIRTTFLSHCFCGLMNGPIMYQQIE